MFTLWNGIVYDPMGEMIASSATETETSIETTAVDGSDIIVLDETTLYTLSYLARLNDVAASFEEVYVAPALKATIDSRIQNDYLEFIEKKFIHSYAGMLVPRELNRDEWSREKLMLEDVSSWISSYTTSAHTDVLAYPSNQADILRLLIKEDSVFSKDTVVCALITLKKNGVLCCDDYVTRHWLRVGLQTKVVGVECLLYEIHKRGSISKEQLQDSLIDLAMLNYVHVKINADIILRAWERDGYVIGRHASRMVDRLRDERLDVKSVVGVVAVTVKEFYARPAMDLSRSAMIDILYGALMSHSNRSFIRSWFPQALNDHMRLLPFQFREALEHWKLWLAKSQSQSS